MLNLLPKITLTLLLIREKQMLGVSLVSMELQKHILDLIHGILLKNLHCLFALLWFCARDVNELLKSHEKSGGHLRPYGHFFMELNFLKLEFFVKLDFLKLKFYKK